MKKSKYSISIDDKIKPIEMREGLWEALDEAVRLDPLQRYSNRSECIRHLIIEYVDEVNKIRKRA